MDWTQSQALPITPTHLRGYNYYYVITWRRLFLFLLSQDKYCLLEIKSIKIAKLREMFKRSWLRLTMSHLRYQATTNHWLWLWKWEMASLELKTNRVSILIYVIFVYCTITKNSVLRRVYLNDDIKRGSIKHKISDSSNSLLKYLIKSNYREHKSSILTLFLLSSHWRNYNL